MNLTTKFGLLSVSGLLSVAAVAGGTTFALFSAQTQNNHNQFTAGKLTLSTQRADIPMIGPMFYTNDNPNQATNGGIQPTGYWAPRDSNTRAMYINNTGSLDGKLVKVVALPQDSSGQNAAVGSTAYQEDMAIANQANVLIQEYQFEVQNSDGGYRGASDKDLDATTLNRLLTDENSAYEAALSAHYFGHYTMATWLQDVGSWSQQWATQQVFVEKNLNGDNIKASVVKVYDDSLANLVNGRDVSTLGITLPTGKSMYVGYTVTIPDLGTNNNAIMGKNAYFAFEHDFQQLRNNA